MTERNIHPAIGQQRDWKDHTTDAGEYWHPTFWSPVENLPAIENDPEWFFKRLDHFHLETQSVYLGDGEPKQHEQPLLRRYMEGDKTALRDWVPQLGPAGTGWFILTVQDSDDGPFVVWARVRENDVPEGAHPIKDIN